MRELLVIVVFYNPTEEQIEHCKRLSLYFTVFAIDNSNYSFVDNTELFPDFVYKALNKNYGIAYAQNLGLDYAINNNFKYVVFFDQDSEADNTYCEYILSEYKRVKKQESTLAMLGPKIIDKETGLDYKNSDIKINDGIAITTALINSGVIAEVAIFIKVGYFESDLFIDLVDFEWCWRAISKGYVCAKTHNVTLLHKVGQKNMTFWGYPIIVSAPFRYYYQYRNFIILLKRSYVPRIWKIKTLQRKFVELLLLPIRADGGLDILKYMIKGISDGFCAK